MTYIGETPEGTGQAEDYRLKLSLESESTIHNKKSEDEVLCI